MFLHFMANNSSLANFGANIYYKSTSAWLFFLSRSQKYNSSLDMTEQKLLSQSTGINLQEL